MITAHRIGFALHTSNGNPWNALDATTGQALDGDFRTATAHDVDRALQKAASAFETYRSIPAAARAAFLRAIATHIEALGDTLVGRVMQESALAEARVRNERARTTAQLRMFADHITEGAWADAVIDHGDPQRSPPKPDLRRMLHPVGPVVVFTASNFPLAYSTAGGDTASALAAGCPVIVKAHEAHPGTNALVAEAILAAAEETGMPDGVFSTLYAQGYDTGAQLVTHPLTKAVGFTGSRRGGRALFDLAARREAPVPVFAEMSSVNPIFLLPEIVKTQGTSLASQIAASVNLGAGQFCTCPGLIVVQDDAHAEQFIAALATAFAGYAPLTMLHAGIMQNYLAVKSRMFSYRGVEMVFHQAEGADDQQKAGPAMASVHASEFLSNGVLQEEVFGPFTMVIRCADNAQYQAVAKRIDGQLTATLCGTEEELIRAQTLTDILREKAGRLVFNGVPTGVEVCSAMVHGGPYPATTDSRFTAVGHAAILRWVRPVAFQNCPQDLLPDALKDVNVLGIWRTVDGVRGRV